MPDQKNYLIAIVLSIMVLVGWQYLYVGPRMEAQRARDQALQQTAPGAASQTPNVATTEPPSPGAQGVQAPTPAPGGTQTTAPALPALSRDVALRATPRVAIDTPSIRGSINLRGGRIDDVALKNYRETVSPDSPNIVLFSPSGSPNPAPAYYAEFGWAAAAGVAVPGPDTLWTAQGGPLTTTAPVTLTWDNGAGLLFRRTVALDDRYMFTVTDAVENRSAAPVTLHQYGLVSRHGEPVTLGFFILHEGLIGVLGEHGLQEYKYSDVREDGPMSLDARGGWLGITDKYWLTALSPVDPAQRHRAAYRHTTEPGPRGPEDRWQVDFSPMAPQSVAPGATGTNGIRLFAGAKEVRLLDSYGERLGIPDFDKAVDFGWFYFLTKPFFYALDWLFTIFGNFGVAILVFTLALKAAFFPLANKAYKSMSRMKILGPKMQEIRERHKEDPAKAQSEMMALYRTEKINPASGCLPILIQIPVFFALYKVLFVTIEMRHAPFFGWIKDLSAPDPTNLFNLFGLLPYDPMELTHYLHMPAWALIMGATMYFQQKLNPQPPDPIQAKIFQWMPVIFTFMLASFPAGLVIYWAWNNALSVLQQGIIMRRNGVKIELWDNLRTMLNRKPAPAKG